LAGSNATGTPMPAAARYSCRSAVRTGPVAARRARRCSEAMSRLEARLHDRRSPSGRGRGRGSAGVSEGSAWRRPTTAPSVVVRSPEKKASTP
jgi:hypothetical protein